MSTKGISYDGDKVQAEATDGMPAVDKYLDKAITLKRMIDEYIKLKDEIITQIQGLQDRRYVVFLYLRYVKNMRMDRIAKQMHYSDRRIYEIQNNAIRAFGSKYAAEIKKRRQ